MRASGWPLLIIGSSDSGSSPVTYRKILRAGGSVLPKYTSLFEATLQDQLAQASKASMMSALMCFQLIRTTIKTSVYNSARTYHATEVFIKIGLVYAILTA